MIPKTALDSKFLIAYLAHSDEKDNSDAGFDEIYNRHNTGTSPKKTTIKRHTPITGENEQKSGSDNPPPYEEAIAACQKCHSDRKTCVCGVNASNSACGDDKNTGNGDVITNDSDANAEPSIKKTVAFDMESCDVTGKGDSVNTKTDDVISNCVNSDDNNMIVDDNALGNDDGIPLGASADNVFSEEDNNSNQGAQSSLVDSVSPVVSPSASPVVSPSKTEPSKASTSRSSHRDDEVWDYSGGTENQSVTTETQSVAQEMDSMSISDIYFREEAVEDNEDKKTKGECYLF